MMEFQKLIEARRSVRSYKEQKVEKAVIEELILAAQQAPSWKNSQTGRYYAVTEPELLATIKETCMPEFNRNNTKDAPAYIISTYVKNRAGFDREGNPDNELGNKWGTYDLGLQNAYLLLKAKDMGLDTLIMGLRDEKKIGELLGIPESEELVAVIALGYSDAEPAMPKRKELDKVLKIYE